MRRILVVDSHPLIRRGLTALIDNEPDLTVCASVSTHDAALDAIAINSPVLVITDLPLADGDGLGLVRDIHSGYADLPILVLSMHNASRYAERVFDAGASGYVTKQEMTETLLTAIRCVIDGDRYLSDRVGVE